ncbi:PHD finger protein 14 [Pseudolycoriella hygida]|uniref:PHD finger protein 14 n=1 Tax=Pseudolycoriella hygida TaxID=35572 RepID=A0A9Q0MTL1_9DIPT|nr:PHD finger protein 14 [Pseudolycoriella hygida]
MSAQLNKAPKRRASGNNMAVLLHLDLEESSSDSDFRIEDHDESDDFSDGSNEDNDQSGDDDEDDEESDDESDNEFSSFKTSLELNNDVNENKSLSAAQLLQQAKAKEAMDKENAKLLATPICCCCLGDRSDDSNEIVECDNCGMSVHEGCYGISDSGSVSSTVSSCSTEPWFCEACKANISDPVCELCPNKGGIFKETDVGKWVHLVCALYVPGVAFGEVDLLSSVTLFEMPYSKWGAKSCSLCDDVRYARTGVCIGCDAGMCKTFFHVTCAQSAGLLSEANSEETDHADPFYAHCKLHSDKTLIKHRKRNYNGLKLKLAHRIMEQEQKKLEKPTSEQQRIERKLKKHRNKYVSNKTIKNDPWVPTQKMPRLLTTSSAACRRLFLKAELMGIDSDALEFQEAQIAALSDVRKKWHIPPAFSVEFVGYYLDRITRVKEIKTSLHEQLKSNQILVGEQQKLRDEYDQKMKVNSEHSTTNATLKQTIENLHASIHALCPDKSLPTIENIGRPAVIVPPVAASTPPARPMSVPTAAALKMGVGFPLTNLPGSSDDTNRILSTQCQNNSKLMHECGICKRCTDQHLLAKCDTCHLHYHLGCLNPPLTRHPKKSKLYGWQCSECAKSDDSDNPVAILPVGPRKSRTKYSKDGQIVPADPPQSDISIEEPKSIENVVKVMKSPPRKTVEKKAEVIVDRIEEVLVNSIDTKISSKGVKRKKFKNTNVEPQPEAMALDETPAISVPQPSLSADPLDISNAQLIVISTPKRTKVAEKVEESPKPIAPSYYVDHNGMLASIDSLPKAGLFTSELIERNSEMNDRAIHKQNRKKRNKEKHRNRHGPDSDRSSSKEHKKKRKKKSHDDMENPNCRPDNSEGIPKIKIKFKPLPAPGETTAEAHFFYVSANMIPSANSRSRPEPTVSKSSTPHSPQKRAASPAKPMSPIVKPKTPPLLQKPKPAAAPPPTLVRSRRLSVFHPKFQKVYANRTNNISPRSATPSTPNQSIKCDVCHNLGNSTDVVRCDECKKNFHFHCLDPPVKKTPKRRGYSWHCANCDPTDIESN